LKFAGRTLNPVRIDAHQHFWDLDLLPYPWMDPAWPIARNFLPPDLAPILAGNRFDGSIAVQATTDPREAEWLFSLARLYPFIRGVVAWADLTAPNLPSILDAFQHDPAFKGVRHPVHDETDPRWLLRPDVLDGLAELQRRGIPFDLLLRPQHFPLVEPLADQLPDLPLILDHLGKPRIAAREFDSWAAAMERFAAIPQLTIKVSGMITEADWKNWSADDLRPYVQHVWRTFSPFRLMFGSDWPVCLLAGTWKQVLAAFTQALGPQSMDDREQILGATAARVYNIK
jgi:L-fuconolactonase